MQADRGVDIGEAGQAAHGLRWTSAFGRRLDVRIVTLFLGLLLTVQLACFVIIREGIERNARAGIENELDTGGKVLGHLLEQNAATLQEAASLLAADFGFRAAVATRDGPTLVDALDNQASRIGASLALFTNARQELVASTRADVGEVLKALHAQAGDGMATRGPSLLVVDGTPYQRVTVPVRAPQLIGHVTLGFPVGEAMLRDLENLGGLQALLLRRASGAPWEVIASLRRPGDGHGELAQRLGTQREQGFMLEGEQQAAHLERMGASASHEVAVLLLRSVDEAVAPYRRLQWSLLGISILGVLVFGAGSIFTARTITRPIRALRERAEQLGAGDLVTPVHVEARDEVGELARAFETMRIGMREREAQISRLAYWDTLTGLPNRERLRLLLREDLTRAYRDGEPYSLLMLDLDRFKHVNDVLGHGFGDRVLCEIARRLSSGTLREHDRIARLGGDEFAIGLPAMDATMAVDLARRLRRLLDEPLRLDDHTIDIGASFGVATFPEHGQAVDELVGRAEMALYAAKTQQAGVMVYEPALDSTSQASLSLLSELRHAVRDDQLRLFLQPKLSLATGAVVGAEALVRWQHPQRGMVPPMKFIPFAEQTGFIRALTGWMIERCAARSELMRDAGLPVKFAINLSTRDLLDQDLPGKLERQLARHTMDPRLLCLEITESAIMDDPERALQTLNRLHAMGLRLSIDDFGTGYSSLAYLKRLPLHELKIDKSFVMHMEQDPADKRIVRSTIGLAHDLGLTVVAEGVETAQSWALLKALHCDEAQGYYMSRPMPEEEFQGWLTRWQPPEVRLATAFGEFV